LLKLTIISQPTFKNSPASPASPGVTQAEASQKILEFLDDSEIQVFALKGKWGIGKTKIVKDLLDRKYPKDGYYYASLFGLDSIEKVKIRLLASQNASTSWLTSLLGVLEKFNWRASAGKQAVTVPGVLLSTGGSLAFNGYFSSLRSKVFCLDDLERCSDINFKEVLGFIDYLAQELDSHVVLIFNEEKIAESAKNSDILATYREKIIDEEIRLSPAAHELLTISSLKQSPYKEDLLPVLVESGIKSIRVLNKISWYLEKIKEVLSSVSDELQKEIAVNLSVFAGAKLESDFPVSLQEAYRISDLFIARPDEDEKSCKEREEDARKKYAFLQKAGFKDSSSYEKVNNQICHLLECGAIDLASFERDLKELNYLSVQGRILPGWIEIWNLYSSSFRDNRQEINEKICDFLEGQDFELDLDKIRQLEQLSNSVRFDFDAYKIKFIEYWLPLVSGFDDLRALKKMAVELPSQKQKVHEKIEFLISQLSISDVLQEILSGEKYPVEYIDFLDTREETEYRAWLKTDDPEFVPMVRKLLKVGDDASTKVRRLIQEFSDEHHLNAMRAERLFEIESDVSSN